MKITCQREPMLAAFAVAASVAPQRSPKPILQSVKLEATSNEATLTATDLEISIRIDVPGLEVEVPGGCLLNVQRFGSILRESSDQQLRITADFQSTIVKGERSQYRLAGANADEFPPLAVPAEERFHQMPIRLFRELIRRTTFATDTESSRYALGGVLLEFEADRIIAVGTDGRRLAKMEGPATSVGGHSSGDSTTIVPTRAMQLIDRALSDNEGDVRVTSRGNDVVVQSPRATIYARLVEGRFPRWRDVLPTRPDAERLELTVGPFLEGLRQAAIVVSEQSRGVDFTFGEGTLVLSGETAEVGESRVELPIAYNGPSITMALDPKYVMEFLKVLDSERTITLEIDGSEGPALFLTDDGYQYVVMPMARDRD